MLRVLMVLEDYGELMFLQTVLKKLGFDVDAIQNPRSFGDSLLTMNPDLLVMTAFGKRVNGMELNKSVRRVRNLPRAILLRSSGVIHETDDTVAGWLESPVAATDLLDMIADVCGLNKSMLQEKFQKLQARDPELAKKVRRLQPLRDGEEEVLDRRGDDAAHFEPVEPVLEKSDDPQGSSPFQTEDPAPIAPEASGALQASLVAPQDRRDRYKKFLDEQIPEQKGFSVKEVQDKVRELRREEDPESLADLERERKAFVEHLFKKKA